MLKLITYSLGLIAIILSLMSLFSSTNTVLYTTLFFLGAWMISLGIYCFNDDRMIDGLAGLLVGAGSLFLLAHHLVQLLQNPLT